MRRFVFFFFALCAAASLWLGSNLANVDESAQNMVEVLFPVHYDVTLNDASIKNVAVRFDNGTAHLSNGESIAVSSAEFTSVDPDAQKTNSIRVGFLSMMLSALMISALVAVTGFTTVLCIAVIKDNERRRKAELRRQRQARRERVVEFDRRKSDFVRHAA